MIFLVKYISLVVVFILIFTSCTNQLMFNNGSVVIVDDMNHISYEGHNYEKYSPPQYFFPYLSDLSDDRKEYKLDENYIADTRDINLCFLYDDGGILGNWIYKRNDIEIPFVINEADKVDCIKISTNTGDFYVNEPLQISVLLEFFSSEPTISLCENEYSESIPDESISFYAMSGYYGGAFCLERNAVVSWGDRKVIMNDEQKQELPEEVVDIVLSTMK